jgi:hypothetical protein
MKKAYIFFSVVFSFACAVVIALCTNPAGGDVNGPIGGTVLDQAAAGKIVSMTTAVAGIANATAKVLSVENGISNIELKAVLTDSRIKAIAQLQTGYCTVSGDTVKGTFGARVTDQGIQLVSNGKNSTIVRFGDPVGTVYTSEVSGRTHTIISQSSTDDFPWGGMNIKVYKVAETINVGGSSVKVHFYANHRFGLVSYELVFEDGSIIKSNLQ